MSGTDHRWRLAAAMLIALAAIPAQAQVPAGGPPITAERLGALLESQPEFRSTFQTFREEFPADYRAFLAQIVTVANARGPAFAQREAFLFMRRFMAGKMDDIGAAPEADLRQLADRYLSLTRALRGYSVPLCAQFVMSGFSPGVRLSPEILAHLDVINTIQLRAAARAARGPRTTRGEADAEHVELWRQRMWAIDPASATILSEGRLPNASAAEQCDAGVAIYQAVAELPSPQAGVMTADLLRESYRQLTAAPPR